jgi:hypothetical protein
MVGLEAPRPTLHDFTITQGVVDSVSVRGMTILADTEFLGLSPLLSGHSADSVPTPCDSDLGPETKNCRKHNRRL